jgi:hypothetical protein
MRTLPQVGGLAYPKEQVAVNDLEPNTKDYSVLEENAINSTDWENSMVHPSVDAGELDSSQPHMPSTPPTPLNGGVSKAQSTAASRGLNVNTGGRILQHGRVVGLPNSPRPPHIPIPPSPKVSSSPSGCA